ncbi:MAG: hypothetical protein RLY69_1234 [Verrucomicrobiota bacterium]
MGDVFDLGGVFYRASMHRDEYAAGVGNHMRVGKNAVFADDETRADTATESARIPWGLIIWHLRGHLNAQDRAIDIGGCCNNRVGKEGENRELDQSHGSAQG